MSNSQHAKEEVVISPWERDEGFGRKPLGRDQNFVLLLLFSRSFMSDSAIPWTAACQASLSFSISQNLLKFVSIESVMLCKHLIFCRPRLLPSVFPSIWVFSSESAICIRWPKIGASVSTSVLPVNIQG